MTFGQRLKLLREEKNINQIELSKILNVANSTLSLYESDSREPDYETLIKIAEFFNVSTDYLLGLSDARGIGKNGDKSIYSLDVTGLPKEAIKQIDDFAEFIREKYSPYKSRKK